MPLAGVHNKFKMPVQLYCFGRPEERARVEQRLQRAGLRLLDPSAPAGRDARGGASTSAASPARLSAQEMESSVDRLFDGGLFCLWLLEVWAACWAPHGAAAGPLLRWFQPVPAPTHRLQSWWRRRGRARA